MKFIKLTQPDEGHVWLAASAIVRISACLQRHNAKATIWAGGITQDVKESPEHILSMIEEIDFRS